MTSFEADQLEQRRRNPRLLSDDTTFASGKIAFFQYLSVGVVVFLIIAFWDLQVRNPDFYSERAERNRIRSVPIPAARGKIYDRDGRIIVDNHSSFRVRLHRENLKLEHLKTIADGLNLDYEELYAKVKRFTSRPKYEAIMLKQDLTPGEVAFVDSHRGDNMLPELELIHGQQRLYPKGGLVAHVIGYVGEVTETELNTPEFAKYTQGDIIGKTGIEREYNDTLMGVDGQQQWVVDNLGYLRYPVKDSKEAAPGRSLQLSVDLDLQMVAELAMEGRRGAVVALDPRNGEVLAMVSRPAFDLNQFAGRIRTSVWEAILNDPNKPMMNRAIQAQLSPGSTFKPISAIAGLETGEIDDNTRVNCSGGASYWGRYFHCHQRGGHGSMDLHRGMMQSCDTYFYNVGARVGIERLATYGEMAGLGRKTGIDLPHEGSGLMPSPKWKIRTFRQKWFPGETISVVIGQGALTVTPLQLASAIGGLAMGGVWQKPHLIKDAKTPEPRTAPLHRENVERVVYGMYGVVNEGGTARSAAMPGIDMCGKTGTAQLASKELVDRNKQFADALKDNAWFVGFAPRKNPEIVVVALLENGEHGDRAAPIVRDVIKAYMDKKARAATQKLSAEALRDMRGAFALFELPLPLFGPGN
jgi:penicillin-binding protein 2